MKLIVLLVGAVIGAGVMYYLSRRRSRRERILAFFAECGRTAVSIAEISAKTKISRTTVQKIVGELRASTETTPAIVVQTWTEDGAHYKLASTIPTPTPADALYHIALSGEDGCAASQMATLLGVDKTTRDAIMTELMSKLESVVVFEKGRYYLRAPAKPETVTEACIRLLGCIAFMRQAGFPKSQVERHFGPNWEAALTALLLGDNRGSLIFELPGLSDNNIGIEPHYCVKPPPLPPAPSGSIDPDDSGPTEPPVPGPRKPTDES